MDFQEAKLCLQLCTYVGILGVDKLLEKPIACAKSCAFMILQVNS